MKDLSLAFLPQIDDLLSEYEELRRRHDFHTQSFPENLSVQFVSSTMDLIKRVSGANGQFFVQTQKHLDQLDMHCDASGYRVDSVAGGLLSLRKAVAAGYLISVQEHLHAIDDLHIPTLRLHELKGERKGTWSVTVQANWRITFHFAAGDAEVVDCEDYH